MNLPDCETLVLSLDGAVLRVTLNRPESRNSMTGAMISELDQVFECVAASACAIRVVILRGAGGHFCAGADLKEVMSQLRPPQADEPDPVAQISRRFGSLLRKAAALPAVVVAICDGAVLGGGFGLACVSDIALAHVAASFGLPETTRGLPPAQIAPFVVERIGLTQARKLCLTGARFDGAEALRLGLVHQTYADEAQLSQQIDVLLGQILSCAPHANAVTKAIVLNVGRQEMDEVLDDAAQKFAACVRGSEVPEGLGAFMQKRAPRWARQP
nr:enoyl-CoA hydratase-related protein [Sinimarinibacterium sp. CAU 1509]